jgi:hypothetical protein
LTRSWIIARAKEEPEMQRDKLVYLVGVCAAILIGLAAGDFYLPVIGLLTLAPVVSHVRHVGWRHAVTEPSAITLIVGFYVLFFPLRGLVIAESGYTDTVLPGLAISASDLVSLLFLASASTTALVEGYYLTRRWTPTASTAFKEPSSRHAAAERLTYLLTAVSLLALMIVVVRNGGVAGTRALYISHSTVTSAIGNSANGTGGSVWALFANPASWCCAYVIFNVGSSAGTRAYAIAFIVVLIAADLYLFGSRLNTTLVLIGVWIVYHYSGRRIPMLWALLAVPLAVLISQPILATRSRGSTNPTISKVEQYSRTAGYGVLDVSLRVHQHPQELREQAAHLARYADFAEYLVPSFLWHGRPNISKVLIGYYTAIDVGTVTDRHTGLPTTYITEAWLLFGWPGAILWSLVFGMLLGWASRRLVGGGRPSPGAVLGYCFIAAVAWNYYKDGDILMTFVGQARAAVYLLFLLVLTGVVGTNRVRHTLPTRQTAGSH